ncbi:MAG TPA: hypothetical protein DIC56_10005 [Rhizobium sp.]|nr:hypothetical protein [Rhizobium sp.]
MKRPVQINSAGTARSLRRDMMVGTAVLLMIDSGFGGIAAAMGGSDLEPAEPDTDIGDDEPARNARPAGGGSNGRPDTHVATSGNSHPLPPPDMEADSGTSSDLGIHGSSGVHHAASLGKNAPISQAGSDGGAQPGHYAGAASGEHATPPSPQHSGSGAASADAAQDQPQTQTGGKDMTVRIGTDSNDVIRGGDGNDYMFGRDGADLLIGGEGKDRLLGGKGDDVLLGGAGNDMLVGDKGDDTLSGGFGSDTFIFRAGFGDDTVTDFNAHGEHDIIEIARAEFADFAALAGNLADTALGVTLTLHDGSTLTLSHVAKANLTANDFHFEL